MIQWVVTSSILIVVIAALRYLLRGKISLRLQYALWALVLLRLLVPVSFGNTDFSVMNAVPGATDAISRSSAVLGYIGGETPDLAIDETDPNVSPTEQAAQYEINRQEWQAEMDAARAETGTPITLSGMLRLIWLSGAALMALWLIFSNLRFSARLRRSRRELAVDGCALPVYVSEIIDTPCLFGLLRPAVYLTPAAAENETVLHHSVEHETTHFRHGDHIWAALRGACLALHWYNPLVWLAAALARRDAELACDEATIKKLGENERTEYGRTLIGLTCQKRAALLLTATTMTGGKRSIKERIALIAKKPKTAIYSLITIVLIVALAVGCTFTGAEEDDENGPWLWAQAAAPEQMTENDGIDTKLLAMILNELDEEDFSLNSAFTGGTDMLTVIYAEEEYAFTLGDGGVVTLEFDGAFWDITSPELYEFVGGLVGGDEPSVPASSGNLTITVDIRDDIPQAVIDYAVDYVEQIVDAWNNGLDAGEGLSLQHITKLIEAKVTGLTQISAGTAGLNGGETLWLLEYRLLPDDAESIGLADGMQMELIDEKSWLTEWGGTGQPYLLLHWEYSGDNTIWQRICVTDTLTMQEEYATPEMLEQYGDMYTAAAMELYELYSSEGIESLIIDALNSDGAYATAAQDALIDSLIENPTGTLEAIGARQAVAADWLCWMLASEINNGMALDTGDALSGEGLSESGLYARDLILSYFEGNAAAPQHWRQVYLDFWDNELPAMIGDEEIIAAGLFDTQSDGVPELAIWFESSTDGTLYYIDDASVYHNIGSIYEGTPPDDDPAVLHSQNGEGIDRDAMNVFLSSWRP